MAHDPATLSPDDQVRHHQSFDSEEKLCFLYEIKPAQFVKKIIRAAATWPRKAHICMTNPACDAGWHFLKVDRARV